MFAGFNREVRNSLRVMGLRIRYAVAVVEIAAEQYGANVAANIALRLASRGTGNIEMWAAGRLAAYFDSNGNLRLGAAGTQNPSIINNALASLRISSNGSVFWDFNTNVLSCLNNDSTITGGSNTGNDANGKRALLLGGDAWNLSTNRTGGSVDLCGGAGTGTGTRGQVRLGYDGTNVCRVTVRNTILGLNGYTSSAADPTTTELATAGDYGIHKNTTSGTVYLAFNDGGTIKKVALA